MSKLSFSIRARILISLVLCLLLLSSSGASLAQPVLDESEPASESRIESGVNTVGIMGEMPFGCNYETIADAVASAFPDETIYISDSITHTERIGPIDKNLTLVGGNADCTAESTSMVTIDSTGTSAIAGGIVSISTGATVTFRNLVLTNGSAFSGGGLYATGAVVNLENVQVISNNATTTGGGIALNNSSTLNMVDSEIRGNSAGSVGGGISTGGVTQMMVIRDSIIIGNSAGNNGGGIYNGNGAINIQDTNETTAIIDNDAGTGNGGGIYHTSSGTLEMYTMGDPSSIVIAGNSAGMHGGGIFAYNTNLDLHGNIQVIGNEAASFGGGLYIYGGDHRVRDMSDYRPWIQGNGAGAAGGGIYLDGVDETLNVVPGSLLDNVVIDGNMTMGLGGGIYATNSHFTLASSHVTGNTADSHGGGIAAMNGTNMRINPNFPPLPVSAMAVGPTVCDPSELPANVYCSVIRNNQAAVGGWGFGGGVYVDGDSPTTIYTTEFGNNQALVGGAFYSNTGTNTINLFGNLFHHNSGTSVIKVAEYAPVVMVSNTVADNTTEAISFDVPTSAATFVGNIFWDNTAGLLGLNLPTGACNDSQDGSLPGDINSDPQFVRVWRGDYRLSEFSPAVDACSSGSAFDLDMVVRPYGADYDMGAFEYVPLQVYLPLTSMD